ncbi:xanthine dehydrogenase family protein molybdopterin-binding subunit [Propylenella binzhouense]|uniref:Xanthine dehydrogenase family protein molybdopterin-binding subunit n=1 Tax=Propylenella binzhouense TaxID=2555902 RepID=A0A964T4Y0_9HYPH|nr:xanthine dehydrogenase family protein molybdopterin-binding subunit [Propylenella binzhouense]MYZ48586.1 xanthine dehydrogenase family protein molybdopterin-binding subunit [Propylenella binzhouense]
MGVRMFGASVKRKEDPAFLSGKGRYVDDIVLPNMAYAAFVRSPFGHARINGIDKSAALAVPGVLAVLAYDDLPETLKERPLPLFVQVAALSQPKMPYTLAVDEVRYVGEPVAVVVAESRYIAEDAAALVDVDYEPLPAVADCLAALAPGAPPVHAGSDNNVAARMPSKIGDVEAAFAGAPHIFKERIFQHRGGAFFMECRGAIGSYDPVLNSLLMYISSQGAHRIKRGLLDLFDLGDHQIRVVTPDVGGGFGPKGSLYVEYPAVAACSMLLGRPVKWIEDRRENFVATHQERDQYWDVEIAVDGNAKILGVRGTMTHDNGAYTPWGIVLPWISVATVPGPYVVPAFHIDMISVLTNKVPATPVRGAGRPQAVVVMERLMDRVALELGLDPAEVRRRNFIQPEQMPYKVGLIFRDGRPVTYDSGDYPACQAAALDAIGYEGFRARQEKARQEGRYIGIGIGNAVEGTGLGPYEGATVRVATNGRLVVYTGATPQGQSHKTTLAQIAADHFGVGIDDISVETSDTATISLGVGSFAARTAVNAGSSVHLAATKVAEKIKLVAADMLEVSPDDLELKDGFVHVKGVEEVRKSFREVAVKAIGMPGFSMAGGLEPGLEHTAYFTPDQSTYANGTTVTEVEVDIETGRVKILRLVLAHDCGRVINPLVVDGQIVGGVAHGVGNALYERLVYDDEGQPLSTNFGEYLLPLAADVPRVEIVHQETPSPLNPLGIKGAGEGGTIPTTASVIGAIEDALSPFGVRIAEAPISPQRIVELLGEAALGRTR